MDDPQSSKTYLFVLPSSHHFKFARNKTSTDHNPRYIGAHSILESQTTALIYFTCVLYVLLCSSKPFSTKYVSHLTFVPVTQCTRARKKENVLSILPSGEYRVYLGTICEGHIILPSTRIMSSTESLNSVITEYEQ